MLRCEHIVVKQSLVRGLRAVVPALVALAVVALCLFDKHFTGAEKVPEVRPVIA